MPGMQTIQRRKCYLIPCPQYWTEVGPQTGDCDYFDYYPNKTCHTGWKPQKTGTIHIPSW